MFWRKRKATSDVSPPDTSSLRQMAGQLGVERRFAVRARYPRYASCSVLPEIYFNSKRIRAHDISVGGCCLLDPQEYLGANVGNDVHLILKFADGAVSVHGRIVSRVDHKRHIQFLNLPKARAENLKYAVDIGTRALGIKASLETVAAGPVLEAREIWSSPEGHSVVIEDDVHRLARITIEGRSFTLYKQAWPVKDASTPLTTEELHGLILFLVNIPRPSELLTALIEHVETMAPESGVG